MNALQHFWVVLAFFAIVLFFEGLYLAWNAYRGPQAKQIERRLRTLYAGGERLEKIPALRKRVLSEFAGLERILLAVPRVHALDRFLLQSGMGLTVARFLGITLLVALVPGALLAVFGLPAYMAFAAAAVFAIAWIAFVAFRRSQRLALIESQLPDALDLMARAMQAGHAFSSALRLVGAEGMHPIAGEFQDAFDEINFGMSTDQALSNLAVRVASRDLRYFVVAVLIQRETGGNLAALLENIALLVRERHKLKGTVRVLSAEGRVSAWILGILPFALAGVIMMINPKFLSRLWTDPLGLKIVTTAVVLLVLGVIWMTRLVRFRI